jgi:long-chain acyl-CoA synthetase
MLVAVIVPNHESIPMWAEANGISGDFKTITADERVKKLILDDILRLGKEANIAGFKFPKAVHIETNINDLGQGFSIENDCMTPSFKLRRPQLLARYQADIDRMYRALGE